MPTTGTICAPITMFVSLISSQIKCSTYFIICNVSLFCSHVFSLSGFVFPMGCESKKILEEKWALYGRSLLLVGLVERTPLCA